MSNVVMKKKDLEDLLRALDHPEVKKKIQQIAAAPKKTEEEAESQRDLQEDWIKLRDERQRIAQQYQKALEEISLLQQKNKILESEKQRIEQQCQKALEEISLLQQKNKILESEKKELEEIHAKTEKALQDITGSYQEMRQTFSDAFALYEMYCKLPSGTTERLETVLSTNNIMEFIVKGVQWDNLEGLEAYICSKIGEQVTQEEEFAVLNQIYDGLFDLYALTNPRCHRMHARIAEEYDDERHSRGAGSRGVSGKIERVLFDGYQRGNQVRKSVVWIKG